LPPSPSTSFESEAQKALIQQSLTSPCIQQLNFAAQARTSLASSNLNRPHEPHLITDSVGMEQVLDTPFQQRETAGTTTCVTGMESLKLPSLTFQIIPVYTSPSGYRIFAGLLGMTKKLTNHGTCYIFHLELNWENNSKVRL
jgi:hypothetical protein